MNRDYSGLPAAHMRQVIAADMLRECSRVLELGGESIPVAAFLDHPLEEVVVLGNAAAGGGDGPRCSYRRLDLPLIDFCFESWASGPFGLAALGLAVPREGFSEFQWLRRICHLLYVLSRSTVAVLEYGLESRDSAKLFGLILSLLQPRIVADIRIDLARHPGATAGFSELGGQLVRRIAVLRDWEAVERPEALYERASRIVFGTQSAKCVLAKADAGLSEVRDGFLLDRANKAAETATVYFDGAALTVTTPPETWSYAAVVPIAGGAVKKGGRARPAVVEVHLCVDAGQAGVGVLHRDYTSITGERLLAADPGRIKTVPIFVPDVRDQIGLVCRNGGASGSPARLRVFKAKLFL
jgi:hypothetical protein